MPQILYISTTLMLCHMQAILQKSQMTKLEYNPFTKRSILMARDQQSCLALFRTGEECLCRKGDIHEFLSGFHSGFPPEDMFHQQKTVIQRHHLYHTIKNQATSTTPNYSLHALESNKLSHFCLLQSLFKREGRL